MRQRELGIQFHRLFCIFLRNGHKILPQQHPRRKQIAGCGIGRNGKHLRKGFACVGIVFRLEVANPQDVRGIDIRAGKPRLHLFQRRYSFRRPPREVIRKPHQLDCFVVPRILLQRLLEAGYRPQIVSLLVKDDP